MEKSEDIKYRYFPDSYEWKEIIQKFGNFENFVKYQVLYRTKFEEFLKKHIDFDKIDELITSQPVKIPKVDDKEYNFYHKYSTLGSDYVFLRNNFHVENLTDQEIESLSNDVDTNYFSSTLSRVIFEENEFAIFGLTNEDNIVKSKGLVFEFAFDQKKCDDFDEFLQMEEVISGVFSQLEQEGKKVGLPVSCLTYRAIPDIYVVSKEEPKTK